MGMSTRETLAVGNVAVGLTLATVVAAGEDTAVITVEIAEIRFTVDGSTASQSIGHLAAPGVKITLDSSAELTNFSAIRSGGISASLQVSTGIRSR